MSGPFSLRRTFRIARLDSRVQLVRLDSCVQFVRLDSRVSTRAF